MFTRTQKITCFALLYLLSAVASEAVFAQRSGISSQTRGGGRVYTPPTARPGQPLTFDQAIEQRYNPVNDELQNRQDQRNFDNAMQEAQNKAEHEAWLAKMKNRPSVPRKTDPGYQSPTALNEAIAALNPGDSIELHGDLFTSFDGAILSATYYRGAAGKDSTPVVLLHGKGGSRRDFDPIIPALLKEGMAVLVPDIRGHGKSIEYIVEEFGAQDFFEIPTEEIPANPFAFGWWLPTRWNGYERYSHDAETGSYVKPETRITMKRYDKFEGRDYSLMVFDLQLWQTFLVNENNQERLNAKKLSLVGTEMGAGLAVVWARNDLSPIGGGNAMKQVKTLTLISPVVLRNAMEEKNGNGTPTELLNSNPMRNTLATMIIVGKNNERAMKDAEDIKKILVKGKTDNDTGLKAQYPLILCNTEKQGRDLFALTSARIDEGIPFFVKDRLATRETATIEKSKTDKTFVWAKWTWNIKK